jgi:cell pole-organizing protein PopZ
MEEILASIRRIIADDTPEAAKAASGAAPAAAPASAAKAAPAQPAAPAKVMSQDDIDAMLADQAADEEPGILDLSEPVKKPQAAPAGFRQVPAGDVMFREEDIEPEPPAYALPAHSPSPPAPEALLSAETNAAVSAAFGSLATTILSENSRTIEDLVREMLRPMLKAWLDDNLPGLVERMVRAEIERVARGGR